jgi:hypothetical protein
MLRSPQPQEQPCRKESDHHDQANIGANAIGLRPGGTDSVPTLPEASNGPDEAEMFAYLRARIELRRVKVSLVIDVWRKN